VGEAARPRKLRAGRQRQERSQDVKEGALAAAVGPGQRHQLGVARQPLQIKRQHVEPKAIADAAKASQSQRQGIHCIRLQGWKSSACPLLNSVQEPGFVATLESALNPGL
ncbi:hypothetical protein OY671_011880, partial [Metschnikowia pulcherrima]